MDATQLSVPEAMGANLYQRGPGDAMNRRPPFAARLAHIEPFHVIAVMARAAELEAQGRSIVCMAIGEPDFPTAEPIVQAGIAALHAGKTHYTPDLGLPPLRQAIAHSYAPAA